MSKDSRKPAKSKEKNIKDSEIVFSGRKGSPGYFRSALNKQILITLGLFALPLSVFFGAWIYLGTRMTVWTVLSAVGCLPACKATVTLILLIPRRSLDPDLVNEIKSHQGRLTMCYEMYMTFYEKSAEIAAFAICGNQVTGYSADPKIDIKYMERECQKNLRDNKYNVTVKIFDRKNQFLERLDSMNDHYDSLREGIKFKPDDQYPDLSREELIMHNILSLCL